MDDLLIFRDRIHEHISNLQDVFKRFLRKGVSGLGHSSTNTRVKPYPSKMEAVKDSPQPKTV